MKWTKICLPLLALCLTAACSDDDGFTVDVSQVKPAPDFVDSRDGHVYRCIQVGNRIWMAENLAYYLPLGSADGCITWNEKQDIKPEQVAIDTANLVVTITDDTFKEIYFGVANDPNHDWQAEEKLSQTLITRIYDFYYEKQGQDGLVELLSKYPGFQALLKQRMQEERQRQIDDYVAKEQARITKLVTDHTAAAEAANGGYVAENGYLYSLAGARKAVPAEGGWRLPSDADWKALEMALGMTAEEAGRMNAWRGQGIGTALFPGGGTGFDAIMSGCNAYLRTNENLFIRKGDCAYFWTSDTSSYTQEEDAEDGGESGEDKVIVTYETAIIRQLAIYDGGIWRGTSRLDNKYRGVTYSVRLVRDAQ